MVAAPARSRTDSTSPSSRGERCCRIRVARWRATSSCSPMRWMWRIGSSSSHRSRSGARETDEAELSVSVAEERYAVAVDRSSGASMSRSDVMGTSFVDLPRRPANPKLPGGSRCSLIRRTGVEHVRRLPRAARSSPDCSFDLRPRSTDLVTAMPDFRYDLVPIVESPNGVLAAYCIAWWDPNGVDRDRAARDALRISAEGSATAIVHEVLVEAGRSALSTSSFWGTSGNPEAKALYCWRGLGTAASFAITACARLA